MTKSQLLQHLQSSGVLKTPSIIEAFEKIDRADFVAKEYYDEKYEDYPLPIGYGQTISQPTTVAFMLELLQPKQGEKILDIGSGSGWTTALLAHIVGKKGEVLGVELLPELVKFGKKNLEKYNMPWASIQPAYAKASASKQVENKLGSPSKAPFDKILVSASAEELPQELIHQLKIGGRLVIPIQNSIWQIDKITEDKIEKKEFFGFSFVPLHT